MNADEQRCETDYLAAKNANNANQANHLFLFAFFAVLSPLSCLLADQIQFARASTGMRV
jgi:hypothetical protein